MTPEPIPVLTLWQPWASLCVIINPATGEPYKTIETRGWSTKYRGPLAIHAAAKSPDRQRIGPFNVWIEESYVWWLDARNGDPASAEYWPLPLGAIVATCTLVDVVPIVAAGNVQVEPPYLATDAECLLRVPEGRTTPDWINVSSQRPYGDFTPGRYAWLLADVVPVDPPVPFKGGQGLTRKWTPAPAEQSIA